MRVALLYARALIHEFRWTLIGLGAAVAIGTVVILFAPDVKFEGQPATLPLAVYSAWMALLAQQTINPPPVGWVMALFAVYPLLGFGLIGEGIVRLGFLMVSRRRGEKEWTLVVASTYRDHIVLCGLGHLGVRILEQYVQAGMAVVVIEKDPANTFLAKARAWDVPVLIRDMKEDQGLVEVGIARARAIVIATTDDVANLEVALDARRMNPKVRILIRLFDQQLAGKLADAMDIDVAFSASALAAPIVAGMSVGAAVLSTAIVAGKPHVVAELSVEPMAALAGKSVAEIEQAYSVRVLALNAAAGDAASTTLRPAGSQTAAGGSTITVHVAANLLSQIAAAARA